MEFNVSFDNTFDNTLTAPFVGSGTITFDNNLSDGSYLLSSLTNLSMSFTFGTNTVTYSDIIGPSPALSIFLYNGGTDFYFDGPASTSPYGGAADFQNSSGFALTTEPNYFGPQPYNLYITIDPTGNSNFNGTYGVAIPEPASLALLSIGLLGLIAVRRRKI